MVGDWYFNKAIKYASAENADDEDKHNVSLLIIDNSVTKNAFLFVSFAVLSFPVGFNYLKVGLIKKFIFPIATYDSAECWQVWNFS